ncbi:hypothetical protein HK405_004847 [Cladochytrium tenue]|nr:hypothetical protein HK405_004847 [Cladochytrium tenue]
MTAAVAKSTPHEAATTLAADAADAALRLKPPRVRKTSALADLLCGSIAGVTGKLVEYPLDTVKVRLQTQPLAAGGGTFAGPLDCLVRTVRQEGFLGLYRGLSAPLVGSMLENSGLFFAYNQIQRLVRAVSSPEPMLRAGDSSGRSMQQQEPLSLAQLAVCGFLSGAVVATVLTPVELIKCKMQVVGVALHSGNSVGTAKSAAAAAPHYRGAWDIVGRTLREEGVRGFYRGHLGTLIRESGGGAAWFGVYELVCHHFLERLQQQQQQFAQASSRAFGGPQPPSRPTKDDLTTWQLMLAGALAGMAFNFSLYPADVIKSRMQTAELLAPPTGISAAALGHHKPRFAEVAREIYAAQGVRGFYRGCAITVARSAPTSAVIFLTYEQLRRNLTF